MDFNDYLTPLRKWWRLILAAVVIAAVSSLLATLWQPDVYEARTTLLIGRGIKDPNPDAGQLYLDEQLANTYSKIAVREPIQNATKAELGLTWLPTYRVQLVTESNLLEITVTDTNPARAQAVANELAHQLILNSPSTVTPEEQARQDFINEQLDSFQTQINDNQIRLKDLQDQLGELTSARQIAEMQSQIDALEIKLNTLQTTYANLLLNAQQAATNTISVLVPADLPQKPVGPNRILIVLMASVGGLALAAGAAYLMENLSNTVDKVEDIDRLLHNPVIASIPEVKGDKKGTYVVDYPFSVATEAFRTLRTNLEFASIDKQLQVIQVTSPGVSEGKSTVATNLALIMAQAEKKVILVGADLREPRLHEELGISNARGLTDVFRGAHLDEVIQTFQKDSIEIKVLATGTPPPNPAELLSSPKMGTILSDLKNMAEIIIVDSSPFIVADAAVLSARVDGVLVVIRPEFSKKNQVQAMRDQIARVGSQIVGVVMNQVQQPGHVYGSYYGQYGGAPEPGKKVESSEESSSVSNSLKKVGMWFNTMIKKLYTGSTK
ncbi:MAG: polysaccharide biosynthesis tyrosine autokinase [Chloroflexi bacterium]|nr:polysaccharide biosynthesis tyrosine autokinase [Chloroflexota bacterium]